MTVPAKPDRAAGSSPLRGRYLARNPLLLAALATCDALLELRHGRPAPDISRAPTRILLALGGHLGDAVIATAAIEQLLRALPDTQIGIVLPSWSRLVLDGDPRIRWIHTIDHWKSNRARVGPMARWRRYRATRRAALREIRDVGYDAALDLYGYFPNMAIELHRSAIPVRFGFTSGGFGPLYTHAVPWTDDRRHVAERQVELVRRFAPDVAAAQPIRYSLPRTAAAATAAAQTGELLRTERLEPHGYIVLHPGAGAAERQWPSTEWRQLIARLAAEGYRLVFTGRGEREAAVIADLVSELPGVSNLCDRLDWNAYVEIIRQARLVITVETAAAHVAAATRTPCIAVWSGITSPHHWGPLGDTVTLLTKPVPCAPCFHSRGCEAMTCVRGISAGDVLAEVHRALHTQSSTLRAKLSEPLTSITQ